MYGRFLHHVYCITWIASSIGMTLCNSAIAKEGQNWLIALIVQMAVASLMTLASCRVDIKSISWVWAMSVPPLFLSILMTSMVSLQYVSAGSFVISKSATPIITFFIEGVGLRERRLCKKSVFASVGCLLVGISLYEFNDVAIRSFGGLFLSLNVFASVFERILQRYLLAIAPVKESTFTLTFVNNTVSCLIALVVLAARGTENAWNITANGTPVLILSCVLGTSLCYSGIILQRSMTATGFMVMSLSAKVAVLAWGAFFNENHTTWVNIVGIVMALAGSFAYQRSTATTSADKSPPLLVEEGSSRTRRRIVWSSTLFSLALIISSAFSIQTCVSFGSVQSAIYDEIRLPRSNASLHPDHPHPSNTVILDLPAETAFGNELHQLMNSVVVARAFNMTMAMAHPIQKTQLLTPRSSFWNNVQLTRDSHAYSLFPKCNAPFEEDAYGQSRISADAFSYIKLGLCYPENRNDWDAQEASVLRSFLPSATTSSGVHVLYGTLLVQMYEEFDVQMPANAEEIRIGIHMRHPCRELTGTERVESMFTRATALVDQISPGAACAFLVASDRPIDLMFIKESYPRCRIQTSHPMIEDVHGPDNINEHGHFYSAVISDLRMLATAHHLIGSFQSTFSLLAQELIAYYHQNSSALLVECNLYGVCVGPFDIANASWHRSMRTWPRSQRVFVETLESS